MNLAVWVLAAASLLASGELFRHRRVSTYLAAAGALFEGHWLLLALVSRWLPLLAQTAVFWAGAAAVGALWLWQIQQWQRPAAGDAVRNVVRREAAVLLVLLPVFVSAWVVVSMNGLQADGSIALRGFYNGDTVTLAALTEKARLTDGAVRANPFAADTELEYPTLVHGALAAFLAAIGWRGPVLFVLPGLTLLHVLIIVPLLFLLWDVYWPEPGDQAAGAASPAWQAWMGVPSRWMVSAGQAALTLFVLMGMWDNFIYPQTHFFLNGLFLMLVCLLLRGFLWLAQPLALILLLSNAVTGTVAAVLAAAAFLLRAVTHGEGKQKRSVFAAAGLLWLLFIPLLGAGESGFGWPQFYYSAAFSFSHTVPILLLLLPGVFLFGERFRLPGLAVGMLLALAAVTFVFSTRAIVAENASRFADHAILLALPLLLPPAIQLAYWLRQRLWHEAAVPDVLLGRRLMAVALGIVLLLPAGVSTASAYDNLLLTAPRIISSDTQQVLAVLAAKAPQGARVAAAPYEPFSVPLLTGRSLIRTDDYWLSPQDELLATLRAAFAGDAASQARIANEADYVLLTAEEQHHWDVRGYEQVASQGDISLYRFR
ncbi:MAG: hypothetical protein COT71_00090 [Candidatus Andersenbacteria bacterium CG10_big_fil_rev_8_21_14_0_10_54_11]|uniref:Glycosyltransferase RgtA/B/C/D-like domain-containing protein n=1 Tax=Candidatus Andersenbacteria bacterium CG10_big_fil_rev_8_21_14_0_10_54_11 TaxID=1974485 RepID=A0A2M6X0H1_9BACT|nr:MAG: hypothetical protein COT71_00090 [Candidatus Andersenbacteria bacterium CG10_big_fil_rev_8_21_14_0_10_54_11]